MQMERAVANTIGQMRDVTSSRPPGCNFGRPGDDLVRAIVSGTSPASRALDAPAAAA